MTIDISHHDNDHDGGFPTINRTKKPKLLWAGQPTFYRDAQLCDEYGWQWDGVWFEFLCTSLVNNADDNDHNCVLRVLAGQHALIITGDLSQKGERALVAKYADTLYSDVLVLGHHGSSSSSSGLFLNTVSLVLRWLLAVISIHITILP